MSFAFNFERSTYGAGPLIGYLRGRMTLGPHLVEFSKSAMAAVASRGATAIILEMSAVEALDSAGLGELVILYTAAGQHNCKVCLVNPTAQIVRVLETTRLSGIIPSFQNQTTAATWASRRDRL